MKKGQIIGNAVILVFFLFLLFDSRKLHEIRRFGEMGSGFWPIVILSTATILTAFILLSSILQFKKGKGKETPEKALSPEELASRKKQRNIVVLCAVVTLAYIFVMQGIGFALATLLYVLVFILVLGERRKWVLIVSPVVVTALVLVIFSKFIAIPFPKGIGFF
ncbi:MAG TPA: tripartite tricarboxylate transporter TctB family protein, partial [Thermodesulfobacteriota bacterium]